MSNAMQTDYANISFQSNESIMEAMNKLREQLFSMEQIQTENEMLKLKNENLELKLQLQQHKNQKNTPFLQDKFLGSEYIPAMVEEQKIEQVVEQNNKYEEIDIRFDKIKSILTQLVKHPINHECASMVTKDEIELEKTEREYKEFQEKYDKKKISVQALTATFRNLEELRRKVENHRKRRDWCSWYYHRLSSIEDI